MREGGDILELGADIERAMARITADLPIGIEPILISDQPAVVDRHRRLHHLALAGGGHHPGRQLPHAGACGPARWSPSRSRSRSPPCSS
jgi:hypothetical protein